MQREAAAISSSGEDDSLPAHPTWSEAERVAALREYGILDTPREADFDNIAAIASALCETPIALVNFLDDTRQWFKAAVGTDLRETPAGMAICRHAVLQQELFVVQDTTKDPRFAQNPLVTGNPHLRFYAGALLETPDGLPIGTVCVLDYEPRQLNEKQAVALKALARIVMSQLELRRAVAQREQALLERRRTERALKQSEKKLRLAMEAGQLGPWEVLLPARSLMASAQCKANYGRSADDPLSWDEMIEAVHTEDRSQVEAALDAVVADDADYLMEYRVHWPDGSVHWLMAAGQAIRDDNGEATSIVGVCGDITPRKLAEEQQTLVLREMHHRVQNTLSTVQAIMASTARTAKSLAEFQTSFSSRIVSLARTHTALMDSPGEMASLHGLLKLELSPYVEQDGGRLTFEGPPVALPAELAVPISMGLHELTTNAAKYGALSEPRGRLTVNWRVVAGMLELEWVESGGPTVGVPGEKGFGSTLLERILTAQINATVAFDFHPDGLRFTLSAPLGRTAKA